MHSPARVGPFYLGQIIGSYEITRVLGVGGMGVVYEARDLMLLRSVAIKAPLRTAHAPALLAEAQALTSIHSPAFVTVYHLGHHEGVDFLVTERLFGETLESRLDEARAIGQRLSLEEVLDVLIAIADALCAAHSAAVAQRDLKPANVILCGKRVVLVDFGLFVPEVLVDPANDPAGSIEYTAPEVFLRAVEKGEGPLIDLYALGILAFELLTDATPFAAKSAGCVLMSHMTAPIPDVSELRPDVPRELSLLLSELLAKEPKQRPPSAEAVLWRLKEIRERGRRREKRINILAVDDDRDVLFTMARGLEAAIPQISVEVTTDPVRAMNGGPQMPTDLVLVDLNMPKHNGLEVCMSLLALPPARRPVVVVMSAQATKRDIAVLRRLGVRHFVPKDDDFVAAMRTIIGNLRNGLAAS